MKNRIIVLVAIISQLLLTNAFAGSGKTIVPFWVGDSGQTTSISLTNITSHDLIVSVKPYREDGVTLETAISYRNFQNSNTEIGAGKTAIADIGGGSTQHYGTVEVTWTNKGTDNDRYGLIGDGSRANNGGAWGIVVPVNRGLPF